MEYSTLYYIILPCRIICVNHFGRTLVDSVNKESVKDILIKSVKKKKKKNNKNEKKEI